MATGLKNRDGAHDDAIYDDQLDNSVDNLEKMYRAPSAPERDRLAKKEASQTENAGSSTETSPVDSDGLASAEKTADQPAEENTLGKGYHAESLKDQRRFKGYVRRFATKKNALLGGGLVSFGIIMFLMFSGFSAFELINMRENLLGFQNRFTNHVLQRRRASSFAGILKRMNNGTFESNMNKESFRKAFQEKGFTVEFGEDGKLKKFGFTDSTGTTKLYDLEAKDTFKATKDFFSGQDFGREASRAYDSVLNVRKSLWTGLFARGMYRLYGFVFYDWLDKPRDSDSKAKTPKEELNSKLRNAADVPPDIVAAEKTAAQLEAENTTKDAQGKPVPAEALDTALQMTDGVDNNNVGSNTYAQQLKNNPALGDSVLHVGTDTSIEAFSDAVDGILTNGADEISIKNLARGFADKIPGTALKGIAEGLNIVGIAQTACQVKGTLNFVSNVRNIMLSIELARFAVLWLSAADNQKAGILSSEGLNLAMIYLHTPSPSGTYWGVLQSGKATKADRSRFGMGRNNDGILGKITSFINGVPGASHCNIVNNGFVTIGGFAVGIVAAVFSGGTEFVANAATALTIALVEQLVFQIATPLLIKAGSHMLFNGFENSTTVGAGILGGYHSLANMDAGANGLRPITNKKLAALNGPVEAEMRYAMSQQSFYDRYLNPENGTSLFARVGMAMPKNLTSWQSTLTSTQLSIFNRMSNFGFMSFMMPASARAAADGLSGDQTCTDPQVVKYDIAADTFCVPIMADSPDLELDLDNTENILRQYNLIDDSGTPTENKPPNGISFKEYVDDCFRGRPGILYNANPDKEGNANPEDDTCVISGDKLPGDNKAGVYDRYARWWGYIVDRDSIIEEVGQN